ncbi:MAG: 4-hydroxy-3-methylbut-2-enyl diphosphate reductase [Bacteroidales bacterium]|nr:4-hydroxy-3-methylbut-2-enyl diphosphate reductase [Bacteroidales bacterium]
MITIDRHSGFCFGVIHAIQTAEEYLTTHDYLYCLGDIVHNGEEVARLTRLGLRIISRDDFAGLHDTTVLIRAHGEPPETYFMASQNRVHLIDATCPVVLHLQKRIKSQYENSGADSQILIYGKKGHAEVEGLIGQTGQKGIVISSDEDISLIDFSRPAALYAQTTMSVEKYAVLVQQISNLYARQNNESFFTHHDTICRLVANRSRQIKEFAQQHDTVIFVSGEKSSNGLYLYDICKKANPSSFFISKVEQVDLLPIVQENSNSIGICGATSTPMWLMQQVKKRLHLIFSYLRA